MYQNIGNTNQNKKQEPKDNRVKQDADLQDKASVLGNEAMISALSGGDSGNNGGEGSIPYGPMEEMMAFQMKYGEGFDIESLLKEEDLMKGPEDIIDTRSYETRRKQRIAEINAEVKKEWLEKQKQDVKNEPKKEKPKAEIKQEPVQAPAAPQEKKKKPIFYKDPENLKEDDSFLPPLDDDMVVEVDKSDIPNENYSQKHSDTIDEDLIVRSDTMENGKKSSDRDLTDAAEDLYPVKGWNFSPQKMEDVKTTGGFSKFKNKLAHIFGKVFDFLSSGFGIKNGLAAIRRYAAGKKKRKLNANEKTKIQDRRDHSAIPGWEGAKFDPNATSGEDILADFRRVPTVWSKLTADKASEGEGEEEKPLPPTISIYIDQPKNNSSQTMAGVEMGHSMIGIEYSRFSQISKRYERYKLQYGFYPVVGGAKVANTLGMLSQDAIIPGQLVDDAGQKYTVSRRYPATAKQVNAILKASETYADGGYGYYTRNCTTFVKDMAEIAHLPVSDKLFEKDEVAFSDMANLGRIGAEISGEHNLNGIEENLLSLSQQEDKSYTKFGNKRATEQDFEIFKNSIKNGPAEIKETYSPASTGEHLRRETTGEIGSYSYMGNIQPVKDVASITSQNIQTIREEIHQHADDLRKIILYQVLKGVKDPTKELPPELKKILIGLTKYGDSLSPVEQVQDGEKYPPIKTLQTARQKLSANISDLNNLYFRYFKGDKRLHEPVMKLISLLNVGITTLDNEYSESFEERDPDEDLGSLTQMMNQPQKIQAGGKEEELTPSFYEAYLQIYKTPDKAVPAAHRFAELKKMNDNGYKWSLHPIDKKEWERAKRINGLAMEFVKSHRYMLEKNTYNQQDVDYAFMQLDRENDKQATGRLLETSSGKIYLALILKKIFGGVMQRFKTYINQDEQNKQEGNLIKWLDEDMSNALSNNKDKMLTLVRGQKKSQEKKNGMEVNVDSLSRDIQDTIYSNWISVVFDEEKKDIDEDLQEQMKNIFHHITSDRSSAKKFQNLLKALVKQVIAEDQTAEDDLVKLWNKKKP